MSNLLIKNAIRTMFLVTSREKACEQARNGCAAYLALANKVDEETGSKSVRVPPMRGIKSH